MKKTFLIMLIVTFVSLLSTDAFADYSRVDIQKENIPLSSMSVFKEYDYTFLKTFKYGTTYEGEVHAEFLTADKVLKGEDPRLIENAIVRTKGFHVVGDGGAGVYRITKDQKSGSIKMDSGLYATLIPDTTMIEGKKWAIVSSKQLGTYGNGEKGESDLLNATFATASFATDAEDIFRGIAYIPAGEYKATGHVEFTSHDINIVGEGDDTIIFTDNDYTVWYEFFMFGWGAKNLYIADMRVEAREVDMSKYYRQVVLIDSENCYFYHFNMNIPQEAFSKDYYVDKQYTNFTFYTGNKDCTLDNCTMELMCGTYRGANLGILDFWKRGEENITVMNCTLHDDARDEQVGIFSLHMAEESFIRNVNFINNDMYSYQPLDESAAGGHRTMCFTVAYNDSLNVENIRIAGNHFRGMVDSQFFTFGNVKKCVIENNTIEENCTQNHGASVFLSSIGDQEDLQVRNNEIYMYGNGKANIMSGKGIFDNNKVVLAGSLNSIGYNNCKVTNNKITALARIGGLVSCAPVCNNNTLIAYTNISDYLGLLTGSKENAIPKFEFNNNKIYYYRSSKYNSGAWGALIKLQGYYADDFEITGNTYVVPNQFLYDGDSRIAKYRGLFYLRDASFDTCTIKDNVLQGVCPYVAYGTKEEIRNKIPKEEFEKNNTISEYTYDAEKSPCTNIDIMQNGEIVRHIYTTDSTVKLTTNEGDDVEWIPSLECMASVDKGLVTRKMYGDVTIFATTKNGDIATIETEEGTKTDTTKHMYAQCVIHFDEAKATDIELESDEITLQPGKKNRVVYSVLPVDKVTQKVTWETSDESIATVTSTGIIQGVAPGTCTVTCTSDAGSNLKKEIKVTVNELTVKQMYMNKSYLDSLKIGDTYQLKVVGYSPSEAANQGVSRWESRNTEIATVDENGLVTIVGQGAVDVRAYSMDEYCYTSCRFVITPAKLTGITETHTDKSITLSWDAAKNLTGIHIYQYKDSDWKQIQELKGDATGTNLWQLTNGIEYKLKICPYVKSGDNLYEVSSEELSITTYSNSVISNFKDVPDSIAVTPGGSQAVCIYINKESFEFYMEDTSIATVEETSPNWDSKLAIQGVKNGLTYLVVRGKDELQYTKRVPVYVGEFESLTLNGEGGVKSVKLRWKSEKTDSITGFRLQKNQTTVVYVPLEECTKETIDSEEYFVYTFAELLDNKSYKFSVKPYFEGDDVKFSGGGSSTIQVSTMEYVLAEKIEVEDSVELDVDDTHEFKATVLPANVSEGNIEWIPYDDTVLQVLSTGTKEDGQSYAVVKALKPGTTTLSAVVMDDNRLTKDITIKIIGNEPETTTKPDETTKQDETTTKSDETTKQDEETTTDEDTDKNSRYNVKGLYYVVTGNRAVSTVGAKNKNIKNINIPATVKIKGRTYKVTSVGKNAFKGYKKANKINIGKNVKIIGKNAFKNINKKAVFFITKGNEKILKKLKKTSTGYKKSMTVRVKNGTKYVRSGYYYKVISAGTVAITGAKNKKLKVIIINDKVNLGGITYKVTAITNGAFKNLKKVTKIVVGKNVRSIGARAFYGQRNLKLIILKTNLLKKVGTLAVKGTPKNVKLCAGKKFIKRYRRLFRLK